MADSNYYVDSRGNVWTNVLRDKNGDIVSAIEVDPTTGQGTTIPRIFIGNPGLTPIPATGSDTFFAWKQGEGAKYYSNINQNNNNILQPKTTLSNSKYGVLPPVQTGLNNEIIAPEVNYNLSNSSVPGQPTDARTRQIEFSQDSTANISPTLASSYNSNTELSSFSTGSAPVSVAMPGSTINANYDSNPILGNIIAQPNTAQPVFAPTRAVEFNNVTGGIEIGPTSQVRLASDGTLRITPDTATKVQLGTGVQQAANGDYIVRTGGVAVLPPNTEVIMEPGTSAALMPFSAGNNSTVVLQSNNAVGENVEAVPQFNSAGTIVTDDQLAYAEDASIQNPNIEDAIAISSPEESNLTLTDPYSKPVSLTSNETNAIRLENDTNGNGAGSILGPGVESLGTSENKEDVAENSRSYDQAINPSASPVAAEFFANIIPTENLFKKFSTMTYSVSIYALSAQRYSELVSNGKKSVKGMTLLIQSAGANKGTDINSTVLGNFGAVRSEEFDLDFYIDDIQIDGAISGTGTGAAHNSFEMKFKIIEPNGLTLLDRLHNAVKKYMLNEGAQEQNINYAAQDFLMVIRFYGYDEFGNPISGSTLKKKEVTSDPTAVTEKFIPFRFTAIQFSIENDVVRYNCEAVCPTSYYPTNVTHARIPFNLQISGRTVKEILSGTLLSATPESGYNQALLRDNPDVEINANSTTIFAGLAQALNRHQNELVKLKAQEVANRYVIEFEENSKIGDSTVFKPGSTSKVSSGMTTPVDDPSNRLDVTKHSVKKDQRIYSVPAGTSIVQAIEYVLRNSSYIVSQQRFIIDEKTGKEIPNPNAKQKVFQWYKIRTFVKPLKYDNIVRGYAYEIRYLISRYMVNDIKSFAFPSSVFRGVHKQYNYWFTGENTEILDFKQDFNYLYYQQINGGLPPNADDAVTNTIHVANRFYMPRSNESAVGGAGSRSTEPAANAASILYSPADQAQAELTIVGDPDWIGQSEIFYSPKVALDEVGLGPFMIDGSINYDASEVLFGLKYNTPSDYSNTGLMDVNYKSSQGQITTGSKYGGATVSLAYRANEINTILSQGQFTQRLKGTLVPPYIDKNNVVRGTLNGRSGVFINSNRRAQIAAADAAGEGLTVDEISAGIGGAKIKQSDINTPRESYAPEDLGVQKIDDDLVDMFDGDETAAAEYYVGDQDTSFLASPVPTRDFTDEEFEAELRLQDLAFTKDNTQPILSTDITDNEFEQAFAEQDLAFGPTQPPVQANDITPTQSRTDFQIPQPIRSGPGYTEPEQIVNVPSGATFVETDDEGQRYYNYKGQEIQANSQAALDNQIAQIDGKEPRPFEEYAPLYETRVRWNWRPDLGQYEETEYFDEDKQIWVKFNPL